MQDKPQSGGRLYFTQVDIQGNGLVETLRIDGMESEAFLWRWPNRWIISWFRWMT